MATVGQFGWWHGRDAVTVATILADPDRPYATSIPSGRVPRRCVRCRRRVRQPICGYGRRCAQRAGVVAVRPPARRRGAQPVPDLLDLLEDCCE